MMRIHTSLTMQQMYDALHNSGAQNTTDFEVLARFGSRTHARAFEVRLTGSGGAVNTGNQGSSDEFQGATWDEWGAFLGSLFDLDPQARCGTAKNPTYRDRDHYHFLTGDRFQKRFPCDGCKGTYLPEDTHKRHHWTFSPDGFHCTKCSARRPSWEQASAYAPRAYDLNERESIEGASTDPETVKAHIEITEPDELDYLGHPYRHGWDGHTLEEDAEIVERLNGSAYLG